MEQKISRFYDVHGETGNNKNERLYASHTDYIETPENKRLTQKLADDKQELFDKIEEFRSSLKVTLTGEVTGQATCDSGYNINLETSPSKKYAQKVVLTGSVTGEGYADSFENGIVNINTKYDRDIPQKVKLTGDVSGEGTVDKDGLISVNVTVDTSKKVPLPVSSIQFAATDTMASEFSACFGGTWTLVGYVDIQNQSTGGTENYYIYKKTAK